MTAMNPKVDEFLRKAKKWPEEMEALRAIISRCGLTEELKWGKPCYSLGDSNLLIIQPFKDYCALMFCKGALLKDPDGILVRPGENSQSARQARFTNAREIAEVKAVLKAYIQEAIAAEKAGLKVQYKETSEFPVPEEFRARLMESAALKAAFNALTPGRQRGYLLHFAAPKQSKTRDSRVEKCTPLILAGKGLHD